MADPTTIPNEEIRTPDVASTARLTEVLQEISQLHELDDDWDLDGARHIDPGAIQEAAQLVRSVEDLTGQQGVSWQPPEVGPVPDGSLALTWEGSHRQALMVFRPDRSGVVECVTSEEGARPVRQIASQMEAVQLALWALGSR